MFFTTHSHAFYRSLLASVLYPCRGVSDGALLLHTTHSRNAHHSLLSLTHLRWAVMDEEEAVQLLGIFLAFVNSTSDRRSFRMWWVPFRSRFLEVAYPTPAGTRLRSLSVDAWLSTDSSPRSRRPNSMLHIIPCMLVDWTKHPHHARAMLLRNRPAGEQQRPPQEEGDIEKTKEEEEGSADDSEQEQEAVDNDTAQYLLDLCGHLCTTLPLVDESLPMLRPLMQLYHNLAVVLADQSAPLCSSSAQAMTLTHSHFSLLLFFSLLSSSSSAASVACSVAADCALSAGTPPNSTRGCTR